MTTELTHCPACGHELNVMQQWMIIKQQHLTFVTCKNPDCKQHSYTLSPDALIEKCKQESK